MNIEEIKKLLFTTEGRIGRKYYILGSLGSSIVGGVAVGFLGFILEGDSFIFMIMAAPLYLVLIYASVCMLIKRLHDRNRSGLFAIFSFIPFANIWIGIETIFLKGTTGTNEYGEDPLSQIVSSVADSPEVLQTTAPQTLSTETPATSSAENVSADAPQASQDLK